jgi:chitodextrinase
MDFDLPLTETNLKRTLINSLNNGLIHSLIIALSASMFSACSESSANVNVAYAAPEINETCNAPWNGTTTYNSGETVSSSGRNYAAVLWTQGQDPANNNGPSGSGQPWRAVSACDTPPAPA